MSTCPSKDIHSIYLDNELPAAYAGEYEAHIKTCPKCAAELARLRAVRDMLRFDMQAVTPDCHYLDQSWERLQSRMSYSKVTKRSRRFPSEQLKYIIPAAAAAAVFSVMIPIRSARTQAPEQTAQITPIARHKTVSLAKNIIINGNIRHEMLGPSAFKDTQHAEYVSYGAGSEAFAGSFSPRGGIDPQLNDVDVFRPDFDSNTNVTIRIIVPGIATPPFSSQIDFPAEGTADTVK
jgi:Predicted transmembrane transcriptional regulator (anti-sigma factor)